MTQYKAGQTVEVVTDKDWSAGFQNGDNIVLREMIPLDECFGGEWRADASNGSVGIIAEANFKPVSLSPVRTETVTKRRIVPGVYGRLRVGQAVNVPDCARPDVPPRVEVDIELTGGYGMTATELDDLAMVASQLAEALRDLD